MVLRLSLILIFFWCVPLHALESPKTLYEQGHLEDALKALNEESPQDATWHLQAGMIYLKMQALPQALGHLEHSLKLSPLNFETMKLVGETRALISAKIGLDALDRPSNLYELMIETSTFQVALRLFIGVWILSIIYFLFSAIRKKNRGFYRMVGVSLFLLLFSIAHWVISPAPPGYILQSVSMRSGPGDQYLEMLSIPGGSKVRILNQKDSWMMIRFVRGTVGWVPASSLLFF